MSDDLVKRLRDLGDHAAFEPHMHHTAADRIEELEREVVRWHGLFDEKHTLLLAEKADLRKMALDYLAAEGQASENFQMCVDANEARIDAEIKLKTAEEIGRAFEEDAGQLREKLMRAVEALEKLARLGNGDRYGNSDGNMIARTTLAELKEGIGDE